MTDKPLRIGIFVMSFPQPSETFIVTKVLKLLDAGFDVHIFSVTPSSHWNSFEVLRDRSDVRERVHVMPPLAPRTSAFARGAVQMAGVALRHPRRFARYITHNWQKRRETERGFLRQLLFRLRFVEHEIDILHIEFDAQGIGIVDMKEFLDCRLLYSARGTFQRLSVLDERPDACEYLFRYVDGYHFISDFLESNTRKLGLAEEIPRWKIEPAIDLTLFSPTPRVRNPEASLKLISVGRISWAKGLEFAVDAIAHVRDAGIEVDYTIYGAGPYADAVRHAIRRHGLEKQVRLGGALKREDVPRAYQTADIMVHAALEEGFCNAVIEAQAMELAVVTSDAGGLPENVGHGVTGLVVPRRDSRAMGAAIVELARDPGLRARMGKAGRKRAIERFDLDRQGVAFARLYRELATLSRRPS